MKAVIHLSDSKNRDSRVQMESQNPQRITFVTDSDGHPVERCRVVKNSRTTSLEYLSRDCALEDLSQALVDGDPEIDFELYGKRIYKTTRLYLNSDNEPAYGIKLKEFVYDRNGELKEERKAQLVESNINLESPLKWTGKLLPKKQFYNKFLFVNSFQISHVDGLTFDFLYQMAEELETKEAFLFLAAGEKSNEPLVFSRNGLSLHFPLATVDHGIIQILIGRYPKHGTIV